MIDRGTRKTRINATNYILTIRVEMTTIHASIQPMRQYSINNSFHKAEHLFTFSHFHVLIFPLVPYLQSLMPLADWVNY